MKIFVQALKLTWLKKFQTTQHKWKNIALINYPFLNRLTCFGPNVARSYTEHNMFWSQVFCAYEDFYYKEKPSKAAEVLAEHTMASGSSDARASEEPCTELAVACPHSVPPMPAGHPDSAMPSVQGLVGACGAMAFSWRFSRCRPRARL